MFSLSSSNRFFLYAPPTDMRKGFDSLSGLVRSEMKTDPADGSVYIFMNKNRNLLKLLHWETGGFTMYYKRLEKGVFERPSRQGRGEVKWQDLVLMVEGIELGSVRRKIRYKRGQKLL